MTGFLARQEFPVLEILDVRSPDDHYASDEAVHVKDLAEGVSDMSCLLKSLAIGRLTAEGLQVILQGLLKNRSLVFFQISDIVEEEEDTKDGAYSNKRTATSIPWSKLRRTLVQTLQRNTALERFVGPRPLIHCPQVQLYLQLNQKYHRRDIGSWSDTLVALVLAKVKEDIRLRATHDDDDNGGGTQKEDRDNSQFYFPTHEPLITEQNHDPRSTMFYILQSRPDILISKQ